MSDDQLSVMEQYIAGRLNVLTRKTSAQIAASPAFSDNLRAHCFYSAQVCEARIVDKLRTISDRYTRGEIGKGQAMSQLRQFLGEQTNRKTGKKYLVDSWMKKPDGYSEEEWRQARRIENLASTARLRLILQTNEAQAQAVRDLSEKLTSGVKYLRYVKSYKADKRPDHLALVGMILPVDHPFWQHFPRDYNCGCSYESVWDADDLTEPPADGERLPDGGWRFARNGQLIVAPPNKSGYDFNAAEAFGQCDLRRIKRPESRRKAIARLAELAKTEKIDFHCVPGHGELPQPAADVSGLDDAIGRIEAVATAKADHPPGVQAEIKKGAIAPEVLVSLGRGQTPGGILFRTTPASDGLAHHWSSHRDEYRDGRFGRALRETLGSPGTLLTLSLMRSGPDIIDIFNPVTGAFLVLRRHGTDNGKWYVVSAQYVSEGYRAEKQEMR